MVKKYELIFKEAKPLGDSEELYKEILGRVSREFRENPYRSSQGHSKKIKDTLSKLSMEICGEIQRNFGRKHFLIVNDILREGLSRLAFFSVECSTFLLLFCVITSDLTTTE